MGSVPPELSTDIQEGAEGPEQIPPELADVHKYIPAPELIYNRADIVSIWVSEFDMWFVNRREFYVQNFYVTQADYEKRSAGYVRIEKATLSREHIIRHLCGIHTIGLYAINPETNSCKWFALDADYNKKETGRDAKADLQAVAQEMKLDGLWPAFENSHRGGHLWLLCDQPVPARVGRIYLYNLLDRLCIPIRGARKNSEGIEIFPKQETLDPEKFGNGLRAPLGIHRKVKRRYWFQDADPNIEAQFKYLRALPRATREEMEALTEGMDMPDDLISKPFVPPLYTGSISPFEQFDIREFTPPPRGSKTNYMTRCPSCAKAGRDKRGDNLHVSPSKDPKKSMFGIPDFYCHGAMKCTFSDIVSACGWRPTHRIQTNQQQEALKFK